jgi:hypothetical protein
MCSPRTAWCGRYSPTFTRCRGGVAVGGAFVDVDLADDLRLFDLNVKSVVHLAKRVVVDMIPRPAGTDPDDLVGLGDPA